MMDSDKLVHFLIIYNHGLRKLEQEIEEFSDPAAATHAYEQSEADYSRSDDVEVVLLGSDSIETVKRTHPNYFEDWSDLEERGRFEQLLARH